MAIAPTLGNFDYILEADRKLPPEEQTIWHLRTITHRERGAAERRELRSVDGEVIIFQDRFRKAVHILQAGLLGWTNFRDAHGREVEFRQAGENGQRRIADEVLDLLQAVAVELADAIDEKTTLSEGAAKNS